MISGEELGFIATYTRLKLIEPFIVIILLTIITITILICCIRLGRICKSLNQ